VRLVNVASGEQLWSESYDRPLDDLFAVQDEIARHVVEALRAALLPTPARGEPADVRAEVAAATRGRGQDPEAHRLFLLGRYFTFRRSLEDMRRGAELYQQAVARDPSHALAWAELGNLWATLEDYGELPVGEGYRRARESIERALAIEPDLPEGHARMGRLHAAYDRDWRKAEASFRRALQGAPGNPVALHGAAIVAQGLGRSQEAIELNRRAIAVDPLGAATYNNLGAVHYECGQLEQAEKAFRSSLELTPNRLGTRSFMAQVIARQGRIDEAEAEASREPDDVFRLLALVVIHEQAERSAESDAVLRELTERHGAQCPVQVAEAHGTRGEADQVFEWLERAAKAHDSALAHIKPNPHFRSVHADPRWPVILAKLGVAE
jgi:tetratricopeptide (TPR) repeat protein